MRSKTRSKHLKCSKEPSFLLNLLRIWNLRWSQVSGQSSGRTSSLTLHDSLRFTLATNYWAVQWNWSARVNALCNLPRKKSREVAASLWRRFLSRRCFTLCITMEVEPRIAKQYKCHHCCSCKIYRGKGMEGGEKKVSLHRFVFLLTRRSRSRFRGKKKKKRFGASYSTSNKLLLVARHILTTGLQKCL